ncbi:Uncharacterized protein APZ42_025165 [Daphnia magna]|uniref:Uncharacterized protein n=1 Tax=Daphnia magna TaxID=35525 RepID=A0A162DDR4_9CRUS|nr:Uncharacterized protein APZ42_025165 [Daphnia magna]
MTDIFFYDGREVHQCFIF